MALQEESWSHAGADVLALHLLSEKALRCAFLVKTIPLLLLLLLSVCSTDTSARECAKPRF